MPAPRAPLPFGSSPEPERLELLYTFGSATDGDLLNAFDLAARTVRTVAAPGASEGFRFGPWALDPRGDGRFLIGVASCSAAACAAGASTRLIRYDLAFNSRSGGGDDGEAGAYEVLYEFDLSQYSSLGLRPQDAGDLAVAPDGATVAVVLSYNANSGALVRGLFTVALAAADDDAAAATNATLVVDTKLWSSDAESNVLLPQNLYYY